jgi:hypothetical protein
MARGWESKDVEMQLEEAEQARQQRNAPKLTPEQMAAMHERESLELSRSRVLADLNAASNPRYREMLQRSLKFLEEKLAKVPEL